MKKMLALLLAGIMVFSMVACGEETKTEDTKEETKTEAKAEETKPAEKAEEVEEVEEEVSAEDEIAGLWTLVSAEAQGEVIDPADLGMSMSMELEEDGTAILIAEYEGETEEEEEGEWIADGNTVVITDSTGEEQVFELVDGQLVVELEGVSMIFDK